MLYKWHNKTRTTVSDLVSELVKWTESGYVDRGVWTQISSNINTTALPTNLETLQLPPVPEPQPTQLAFMVSIIIARKRICGKAMFLHLSVILFTGIGYLYRGNGFCPGGSLSGGVSVGEDPHSCTIKRGWTHSTGMLSCCLYHCLKVGLGKPTRRTKKTGQKIACN